MTRGVATRTTVEPSARAVARALSEAELTRAIRTELHARQLRHELFGPGISEPAWLMLVTLLLAYLDGEQLSITALCAASCAPSTTALRALSGLVAAGHVERQPDRNDGRRSLVLLTAATHATMRRYFVLLQAGEPTEPKPVAARFRPRETRSVVSSVS